MDPRVSVVLFYRDPRVSGWYHLLLRYLYIYATAKGLIIINDYVFLHQHSFLIVLNEKEVLLLLQNTKKISKHRQHYT